MAQSNTAPLHRTECRLENDPIGMFNDLYGWLHGSQTGGLDLHTVENETEKRIRGLAQALLQSHANDRGRHDVGKPLLAESRPTRSEETKKNGEDGKEENVGELVYLSHRRPGSRKYLSKFGWLDINRTGVGKRGEKSVFPLYEELSLPERQYGYPVQQAICTEVARGPFMEGVKALKRQGIKVAPANVDEVVIAAAKDFDDFYRQRPVSPPEDSAEILVSAVDCKGIPVRKEGHEDWLGPVTDNTGGDCDPDSKRQGKKKMATVAAVYTIRPYKRTPEEVTKEVSSKRHLQVVARRPRPEEKRVWASLRKSKDDIFDEVAQEMHLRDPHHAKMWVCLTDGERALQLRALEKLVRVTLILDLFHVLERLWDVANAFYKKGSDEARSWVTAHLLMILQGKVSHVARGIRQSATKRKQKLRGKKRKKVKQATTYFMNNREFMRYNEYLAAGSPIGSGAAEGACRCLIKDRLERTGMRWNKSAEAILRMRALELCEDTDEYWRFHIAREHERLYLSRYWKVAK